jgi:hypothetical protein
MRLTELEPEWTVAGSERSFRRTGDFGEAQGIIFACPHHFRKNEGLIGTHSILIWFEGRGAPAEMTPLPRWSIAGGTSFDDLTLTPSIDLTRGEPDEWHGFITNGEISLIQKPPLKET